METGDGELVDRARAGNREAFDELIVRYRRAICGLACLLTGDPFEAEDLAQAAFMRAWLNLDLLSDPAKFAPWLRRIVFGVSIDWLRVFRPDLFKTTAEAVVELWSLPTQTESGFERLQGMEMRRRVWSAVEKLPPRYRLPLTLFHMDGLSHAKVAQALGIPPSTVRSLVTRARQKLQPMLAEYAGEVLPAVEDVLQEQEPAERAMLHITDGESVAGSLREAGLPGDVVIYGDLLYEGPAPAGLDALAWRETRAGFLAGPQGLVPSLEEARRYLKACDEALAAFSHHDEVVIWLDYRLSDQLILIRVLDWFGQQDLKGVKLSLICAGRYPGIDAFVGLGQLNGDQLASLADTRLAVGKAQFRAAQAAWKAFTSDDPRNIERALESGLSALPFLAAALRRHLEQFPGAADGLSRTERQALSGLAERGRMSEQQLFFATQRQEQQIFMGDRSFYRTLADLAKAACPLVQISDLRQSGLAEVSITDTGRSVLAGEADQVALNGIDRWLGGVHLQGRAGWRWDRNHNRIVTS